MIVVAGGGPPCADAVPPGAPRPYVVAADGGLEHALALGLAVDVAVGDFDSAPAAAVAAAEAAGTRVERHPAGKDATDLELALDVAAGRSPRRIVVLGSGGGRLDHLVAGLLLLGSPRYAGVELDAQLGRARASVIRGERLLEGEPGSLVTLLALHGPAEGVRTEGLLYPLRGETLEPGSSRGVSNVFESPQARVSVERGVVLAIRPEAG